jgi:hypothetical protein
MAVNSQVLKTYHGVSTVIYVYVKSLIYFYVQDLANIDL